VTGTSLQAPVSTDAMRAEADQDALLKDQTRFRMLSLPGGHLASRARPRNRAPR
jgi:hypothetical protein